MNNITVATDLSRIYVCLCDTPDTDKQTPIFLEKILEKEINHVPFWEFNDGISLSIHSELFKRLIPYHEWRKSHDLQNI